MSNTYEFPGKEDVRITVGDEKQQDFSPRMKIKRWDNEVNFSVGIISIFHGSHNKVGDKVEWNDHHGVGARFYEKPDDQFEFEIILDEKPASGFVLLSIEHKGLDFFYQPELTQREIDGGCIRPDDVIGSYAVYHQSMAGDYSRCGGNNYKAGKAFHIYRPFVTDANGKREWCELDITGAVMKITIPDGIVYPVVIDPTFGYTGIGGSNADPLGATWGAACLTGSYLHTASTGEKITGFGVYGSGDATTVGVAAYLTSSGQPSTRVDAVETITQGTLADWRFSSVVSQSLVNGNVYGVAFGDWVGDQQAYYDTGQPDGTSYFQPGDIELKATWGIKSSDTWRYSLYCLYELVAGNPMWYYNMLRRRN